MFRTGSDTLLDCGDSTSALGVALDTADSSPTGGGYSDEPETGAGVATIGTKTQETFYQTELLLSENEVGLDGIYKHGHLTA